MRNSGLSGCCAKPVRTAKDNRSPGAFICSPCPDLNQGFYFASIISLSSRQDHATRSFDGSVANLKKTARGVSGTNPYAAMPIPNGREMKRDLPGDVALRQPPHLPFADHVSPSRFPESSGTPSETPGSPAWLGPGALLSGDPAPLRY